MLRSEVKKLRDQNIKDISKIAKDETTNLPLPGEEFLSLSDHQKVKSYARAFKAMQQFKNEFEKICITLKKDNDKNRSSLMNLKNGYLKQISDLEAKLSTIKDN